ncbi:sec-independent translocase [Streptomyces sp. NPDC057486]|uniref:sec-independent translocase n=1 Tax=Streptomyces sp. NPDC057486 TaxID=3346145 RepID=UPI0036CAA64F
MFSDVGAMEILTLGVIAVLLFGPDKLPEMIQNVTGFLRKVRAFSENAKQEIRSELGPEFKDFEFEDLHPKAFVRKHILDGEGDAFGLTELRDALDPRQELTQIADMVRGAADSQAEETSPSPGVDLTKRTSAAPAASHSYDPDAT